MQIKHSLLLLLLLGLAWPAAAATPQISSILTSPDPPLANQTFSFTITGNNFDNPGASVSLTGPGCANGCLATLASLVPTQIIGTAKLGSGSFSVVVRNTATGGVSNTVTVAVTTAVPFTLNNFGATTQSTDGSGNLAVGYGTIRPSTGNTTPGGVLIFGSRSNNVLQTESGVPASPAIQSGRIYARVSATGGAGSVNTGIAIVNPNASSATINFHFADSTGRILGSGSCVIAPNHAIGQFLNESNPCPFNMNAIQGTFSFTSNVPVSAVALRSFIPENGVGALFSTLPVVDTAVATGADPIALAHFADGTEWTTEVVLVNPTGNILTGTLQFFVDGLNPAAPIATDKGAQNSFSYSIPAESAYTVKTLGTSSPLAVGAVRVTPTAGVLAPSAMLIFSFKPGGGITAADAGVPSVQGSAFRMYYELSGSGPGSVQSAVAIANLSPTGTSVDFAIYNLDGAFVAPGNPQSLPGNGHIAKSIDELFPPITLPQRGILEITGGTTPMSVVGIRSRYNEAGKYLFTTTPATNEASLTLPTAAPLYFPRLVNGGSWSTQYVLFSGAVGQTSAGVLEFHDNNGGAIILPLN